MSGCYLDENLLRECIETLQYAAELTRGNAELKSITNDHRIKMQADMMTARAMAKAAEFMKKLDATAKPLVRCKECVKRKTQSCPMYHEEYEAFDSFDGFWTEYDRTTSEGFCHCGNNGR